MWVRVCMWVYVWAYAFFPTCGCVSECMCAYTHVCTRTRCAWVALGTCFSAEWFPFTTFTSFQTPSCAPAWLRGSSLKDARCCRRNQSMSNVWVFTWNVILRSRPSRHMKGAPRPQTCVEESSSCPSRTTQLLRLFLSQLSLCLFLWGFPKEGKCGLHWFQNKLLQQFRSQSGPRLLKARTTCWWFSYQAQERYNETESPQLQESWRAFVLWNINGVLPYEYIFFSSMESVKK